jgi:hypothetical protein
VSVCSSRLFFCVGSDEGGGLYSREMRRDNSLFYFLCNNKRILTLKIKLINCFQI